MSVCDDCGYNLPHHSERCSEAPRTTALCPEHATGERGPGSDDAALRCDACGTRGYHVRRYLEVSR